jgi:small-conductance mechanosensitive channel
MAASPATGRAEDMDTVGDWIASIWDDWGFEIVSSVAVLLGAVIVIAILRRALGRWSDRIQARYAESPDPNDREQAQRILTITGVLSIVITIAVFVTVILTVMAIWGIPMSPLVAVGATVGVAIGFGAQDFIKDVIGGFFILIEDQYAVGDIVTVGGVSGTVEAITIRTTVLRDLDGNQHHVPNGEIRVASNLTSGFSRVVIDVPVSYDTDLDRALGVITDEAYRMAAEDGWSAAFLEDPANLGVNELDSSAVNIRILFTTVSEERWTVKREFLKRIKQRLDREGIEIPYQYVNVVSKEADQRPS